MTRKKIIKKKKRPLKKKNKKQMIDRKPIYFLYEKINGVLANIKKGQKKCLRYKKSKRKNVFCFVQGLLRRYLWQTVGVCVIVMSLVIVTAFTNQGYRFERAASLQTSILSQLNSNINRFTNDIRRIRAELSGMHACTSNDFWAPRKEDVCNSCIYKQVNDNCARFSDLDPAPPTKRLAIGEKMCCNLPAGIEYHGNHKNVEACPGSDVFFSESIMHNSSFALTKSDCGLHVCQFYPTNGKHFKVNDDGNVARKDNGDIIIEEDCTPSKSIGSCSKSCGGGIRSVSIKQTDCRTIIGSERCNMQPCYVESY